MAEDDKEDKKEEQQEEQQEEKKDEAVEKEASEEVAEEEEGEGTAEGGEGDEEAKKAKKKKRKKLIIIAIIALFVLGGGGFTVKKFVLSKGEKDSVEKESSYTEQDLQSLQLAPFTVNLRSNANNPNFIKITIIVDYLGMENTAKMEKATPVIRDRIITFLRELRVEDVQGSAGVILIKDELLIRLNKLLYPIQIKDIYFKEILVQ